MKKDHDPENKIPGYIRVDIAKEREAKLIRLAYGRGLDGYHDSEPLRNYESTIKSIYYEAGLEELE